MDNFNIIEFLNSSISVMALTVLIQQIVLFINKYFERKYENDYSLNKSKHKLLLTLLN